MSSAPLPVAAVTPARGRRPSRLPGRRGPRYALTVLAFLLPSAVPLALFVLGPMVAAAWVSLTDWNLLSPPEFVGAENYLNLLADPETGAVFLHTLFYILGYLPLVLVGGLALALALNSRLRGRAFWRGSTSSPS